MSTHSEDEEILGNSGRKHSVDHPTGNQHQKINGHPVSHCACTRKRRLESWKRLFGRSSWGTWEGIGMLEETGLGRLKDACVQIFIEFLLGERNRKAWIAGLL